MPLSNILFFLLSAFSLLLTYFSNTFFVIVDPFQSYYIIQVGRLTVLLSGICHMSSPMPSWFYYTVFLILFIFYYYFWVLYEIQKRCLVLFTLRRRLTKEADVGLRRYHQKVHSYWCVHTLSSLEAAKFNISCAQVISLFHCLRVLLISRC